MIRGWYIGASGMNGEQNRLDAISNNLANVDTTGYKRDVRVSKSFSELLLRRTNADGVYETPFGSADAAPIIGKLGLGIETNEQFTDFEQGSFKTTGTKTDFALGGKGFFTVQTPIGERYTRNGNFFIGKERILETKDGYPVMGEKGIITLTNSGYTAFQISAHRPHAHIIVFCSDRRVLAKLNLLWGVRAFYYDMQKSTDETVIQVNMLASNYGFVKQGDFVVNLNAMPVYESGKTNTLRLSTI